MTREMRDAESAAVAAQIAHDAARGALEAERAKALDILSRLKGVAK